MAKAQKHEVEAGHAPDHHTCHEGSPIPGRRRGHHRAGPGNLSSSRLAHGDHKASAQGLPFPGLRPWDGSGQDHREHNAKVAFGFPPRRPDIRDPLVTSAPSPVLFYFPKRLLEPANSYAWFTLADRLRRGLVGTRRPPENNQNLELSQLVPELPREASGGGGWAPEPRRTQLFPTLKARDGVRPRSGKERNQAQTKRCRSGDDGVAARPLPDPPRNKGGRGASRP